MKIFLTKEYQLNISDEIELRNRIIECIDGYSGLLDEEHWKSTTTKTGAEESWDDVKEQAEDDFYANYPKDKIGVNFPPKTLEDLVRLIASDINEGILDENDLFDEDETSITWTIREEGRSPRDLDIDY